MESTLIVVFLVVGGVVATALFGLVAVTSVRRNGFRRSASGAARAYLEEQPLYWSTPVVAWLGVLGVPVVAFWTTLSNGLLLADLVALAILWLLFIALLRWHFRAKARARGRR